jgi:hypothetical protein
MERVNGIGGVFFKAAGDREHPVDPDANRFELWQPARGL